MARRMQLRKGTSAQMAGFTGALCELTATTDTKELVLHDGTTLGGIRFTSSTSMAEHINNTSNPHAVTKEQIGLAEVDNTSDANKSISNATQLALNTKAAVSDLTALQATVATKANIASPVFTGNPKCGSQPIVSEDITNKVYVDTLVANAMVGTSFISKIKGSGNNLVLFAQNGKLYSITGAATVYKNSCSGKGSTGTIAALSIGNAQEIFIPNTSGIKDFGGNGDEVAFCLFNDGELYTWGTNAKGACGIGTTAIVAFPTLAATDVTTVFYDRSAGYDSANTALVIKKSDNFIYATGYNGTGAFGLGNSTNYSSFTKLTALSTDVSKVFNFSGTNGCLFVQKVDGTILACGDNNAGQLGTGNTVSTTSFVDVTEAWGGVSAGPIIQMEGSFAYYNTALVLSSTIVMLRKTAGNVTSVRTCGNNTNGGLGNGTIVNSSNPYLIPSSDTVKSLACNGSPLTTLMLKTDNTLHAWGYNASGQCGTGTTANITAPTQVSTDVSNILLNRWNNKIYGNRTSSIILKADGGVYGCGYNIIGNLGIGSITNTSTFTLVKLPLNSGITDVVCTNTASGSIITLFKVNGVSTSSIYATGSNTEKFILPYTSENSLVPIKCK